MPTPDGLDEHGLTALIDKFYEEARADPLLGPIFNGAISDWPAHQQSLTAFWSSVMLGSGRYKGQPVPAHMRHQAALTPAMFVRWLALWESCAMRELPPEAGHAIVTKARRIAESLQMILFHQFPVTRQDGPPPCHPATA
ncbi:MAG: group III truncated hemoglobin [Rhodospirillales bacterium]|nr:group III truncated hemoglobin [Rhodospirillales bacterium]